jgi:hypothetical protein
MQPENFLKFFWYKTTVFGPVQIPQKSFFLRFLRDFVPVLKLKNLIFNLQIFKIQKNFFWGVCTGPYTLLLDLKKFLKRVVRQVKVSDHKSADHHSNLVFGAKN